MQNIVSRPDARIGPTTHHLQIAYLIVPVQKREKKVPRVRRRIPRDLWQDKDVKVALAVALPVELQPVLSLYDKDARTFSPVTLPVYDALESNLVDP